MIAIGILLWTDSAGSRAAFGLVFPGADRQAQLGPGQRPFPGLAVHLWHPVPRLFAIVFALPISLGIAVFLAELCPAWLRTPLSWLVELLAAIPSVVYGLWGIFVFLPRWLRPSAIFLGDTLGKIPVLGRSFRRPDSGQRRQPPGGRPDPDHHDHPHHRRRLPRRVSGHPRSQREAALALGATRWETIWQVLLPYGLSGILGAVILGLGRALGETMAVTMVIGNSIEGSALAAAPRLHHVQHHRQRICRSRTPTAHAKP